MKTIHVNNFGGGIANDTYHARPGQVGLTRNFDTVTYPNKLFPLRGMEADTASTGIGNIQLFADGTMYGMGLESGTTDGQIYKRQGYGALDEYVAIAASTTGDDVNYNLLVDYPSQPSNRRIFYAGTNRIYFIDTAGVSQASQALTFVSMGQGFVHPKDDCLYIPYKTSSATIIAKNNAGSWSLTAFTGIPFKYTVTGLTAWGDYLAIACATDTTGGPNTSVVYLWNRDTSITTATEIIPWGGGKLQVLNNLNGVLIGISSINGSGTTQDYASLNIKAYAGGSPQTIEELTPVKQTSTTPTVTINPRVNFIHNDRLYFSADLVGGSTSPKQQGLWSIARRPDGRYVVTVERYATSDGTDASVIAAAISQDFVSTCHTAEGTLTFSINGSGFSSGFNDACLYETPVNPDMPEIDKTKQKQLLSVACHYIPLQSSGQVVLKYRVDSTGDWTTIFTETTDGAVVTERTLTDDGAQFTAGRNYEFRIESTGFAQITGFTYKYQEIETAI